jgi:8-hydroxy-5-deazaflavin:NADPH oxidoreductase
MKIGILGTGDVGRTLANAFLKLGHQVKMGAREAKNEKAQAWLNEAGKNASAGTFADAAQFGELIVLATLGTANEAALSAAGRDNFSGKILIDTTNPLDFSSGGPALAYGFKDSAGERVQKQLPKAKVVKAFNTVGNAHMFKPAFETTPDMFICGNDDAAKKKVSEILRDFGWGVVDIGGIDGSRYLEPMCLVWVLHGLRTKSWNHAFKLVQK